MFEHWGDSAEFPTLVRVDRQVRVDVRGGDNPEAVVWALPRQAQYLKTEIEGGERGSKAFEHKLALFGGRVALPTQASKLDAYGNMSRSFISRVLADANTSGKAKRFFIGTPKGGDRGEGVWARVGNNNRLVKAMSFADDAQYEERFNASAIAQQTVNERWESQLIRAMRRG